jgi:anti-sigma factor RsiW
MSHVDEGCLHAYLDAIERPAGGQSDDGGDRAAVESHLARCAECRALLADVRQVRERSASLLAVAAPTPAPQPSFADVLARAGRTEQRRRLTRINRLAALGWAATVVLAVGIGWIARGAIGIGPQRDRPSLEMTPPTSPSAADLGGVTEAQSDEARRGAPVAAELARAADVVQRADVRNEEQGGVEETASRPRQDVQTAQPSPAAEPADVEAAVRHETTVRRQRPAPAAPAEMAGRIAGPDSAPDARVENKALPAGMVTVSAVTVPGTAVLVETDAIVLPATEWTPADLETAAVHLDGPIQRIPDLPIRSVEMGALYGEPSVRLVQWSGSVPVELIQSAEVVLARLQVDSQGAGRGREAETQRGSTAALVQDGRMVLLRATLPRDSLRLLARRIP